jgi:hypothetical protein
MLLSLLYLTFLFELCLLGLASFLGDILFWDLFGDFIPKGRMWDQSKLVFPKWKRQAMCEHRKRRSNKGEV